MFRATLEHFYQLIENYGENDNTKDKIAIYDNDESKITYRELNQRVNQLAHFLLDPKNNVNTPETRIGLFFYLSIDYFVSMFAIMKAGLSFVPFSPNTEVDRLQEFAKQSQIKLILSNFRLKDNLFLTTIENNIIHLDSLSTLLNTYSTNNPFNKISQDQLAYVHNTSGSTGKPKQVLINHAGLLNCATDLATRLAITNADKTAAYADISFDAHIAEMMMTLCVGASLYLIPPPTRLNYASLTKYYNSHGITVSTLTPSVLNALSPQAFPTLRVLLSTGEAVTQAVVNKWCQSNPNLLFINGYGPAEVTIATSVAVLKPGDPIHIGTAIKGLKMYVLEKEPKVSTAPQWVQAGERGELYIGGTGVGRGYSDPALTAERFVTVTDPDNSNQQIRLYQTRDEARYELTADKTYQFFVSGRLDRQVKVYGKLICPEEIEALLLADNVIQAQVDPQKTPTGLHPAFIAYLFTKDPFDLYEYYANIIKKLPAAVAPSRWVVSNKTLLSTSSKNALKSLDLKPVRIHAHADTFPTSTIQIELAEIWKQVLEIDTAEEINFTLDDNFFMLGGTSLQVADLLVILRERYQLKLSLEEFLYIPTIGALARSILRLTNKDIKINSPILLNEKHAILRNETPLFLIHSLMGDAELDYEKLVSHWPSQRPIYGINSRSFKNVDDMDCNLDAIANDYINAMKSIQPRGPYLLGGWSAGGLIAYAMCQILKKDNQKVYLHMLDSEALNLYKQKNTDEYSAYLTLLFELKLSSMLNIPISPLDCKTLSTLPKTKQIYCFFTALLTVIQSSAESNSVLKLRRMSLIATVKNTLLAILNYAESAKIDNAILWAATETQKKCQDERLLWQDNEIEFDAIKALDGNHESILLDPISAKTLSQQLERECTRQIEAEQQIKVRYFNRPINTTLSLGREKELQDLQKIFRKIGRNQNLVVISHEKNVGKSQLAADYFNQTTHEYELKFWFRADSKTTLLEDYENLAKQFNLFIVGDNILEVVKAFLDKRENWLAVYDNAAPLEEIKDLLPNNSGHVIVTTQHAAWNDIGFDIGINPLTEKIALELLPINQAKIQKALIIKFDKLPAAIKQLNAYLKQTPQTPNDFLQFLQENNETPPYQLLIKAIFAAIDNDIKNNVNLKFSLDILTILTYLHTSGGSYTLLKTFLQQFDKTLSVTQIELLLDKSLEHLSTYALIQYDHTRRIVHINVATQTVLKYYLALLKTPAYISSLIQALQLCSNLTESTLSNFNVLALNLKQHAPSICAEIYLELSEMYYNKFAYTAALHAAQKALDINPNDFYKIHYCYIEILTTCKTSNLKEILALAKQTYNSCKNLIADSHEQAQKINYKRLNLIINVLIPALIKMQEYADATHYLNEANAILNQINNLNDDVKIKIKLAQYELDYFKNNIAHDAHEILNLLSSNQKYHAYIYQLAARFSTNETEKWQLLLEASNLLFSNKELHHIVPLLNDMASCQYNLNDEKSALNLYALALVIYKKYATLPYQHDDIGSTYLGLANLGNKELRDFYYKIALWHYAISYCPPKTPFKINLQANGNFSTVQIEQFTAQHKKLILKEITVLDTLTNKGITLGDFGEELLEISFELAKSKWEEPGFAMEKNPNGLFASKKSKKFKNIKPNLPWLQHLQFTGREAFLQTVDNHLAPITSASSSTVLTIHGMSGVGKSQSAVQYAYLALQTKKYEFIWFISAANLMDGFLELSDAFKISTKFAPAKRIAVAKEYLETYFSGKWLIIIDDAKDYENTKNAFVGTMGGHFLITSKNPQTWPLKEELRIFNRTESLHLITKILSRNVKTNPNTANDLAKLLGDLPLALMQACAYIHASCTIEEYIDLYATQRHELWSEETPPNDYPTTVSATFELSLKAVNEILNTPELNEFLSYCAYLHQDSIPKWLLKCIIPNPLLLSKIIKNLLHYSLIQSSDDKIAIHPMVQQVMRDKLPNASVKVITLLTEQSMTTDYTHALGHNRELLEHYDAALRFNPNSTEGIHLFFIAGLTHLRLGNSHEAREFFETALKIKEATFTNNDIEYARISDYLGTAYGNLDMHQRKKEILLKSLEIKLNRCKEDENFSTNDIEFSRTYNNLGNAYGSTGDLAMQIHYIEKSYQILVHHYGVEHSESALIQANLGVVYGWDGKKTKAKQYLEQAMAILEKTYGKDHYYVGQAINNLACLLGPIEWDATLMQDFIVDIKVTNDHIECEIMPCVNKQLSLVEQGIAIYKQNFDENNIKVAAMQLDLAKIYNALNNKSKQIQILRTIAPIYQSFFGNNHKETVEITTQLNTLENASSIKNALI